MKNFFEKEWEKFKTQNTQRRRELRKKLRKIKGLYENSVMPLNTGQVAEKYRKSEELRREIEVIMGQTNEQASDLAEDVMSWDNKDNNLKTVLAK